ncbi:MAG: hypothetical protein AAB288_03080, partial [Acidobacteriota bacterium]
MRSLNLAFTLILFFALASLGQVDGMRTATGMPLSVDARIVFGRVALEGLEPGMKAPRVYVTFLDKRMQ